MGDVLLFGGMVAALISQLYIAVLAFRRSIIEGVFCFLVPAYILFWAKRQQTRQSKALIIWCLGLVAFIVGVAVSS